MSLQKCPECGGKLSSHADQCPHCGIGGDSLGSARSGQACSSFVGCLLLWVVAFAIWGYYFSL